MMRLLFIAVFTLILAVAAVLLWQMLTATPPPLPQVRLLTTRTPFSGAVMLAQQRGWFREAGVDVVLVDRPSGKDALADLVDGNGEYATASETPLMFAMLKSQPIRILSALTIGTDTVTLVARRDRGIESGEHLVGKRIGLALGTNSQYFLDTFLEYRGIKSDAVMRIPLRPEEMVPALVAGKVDAISAWTPYNQQAMTQLGSNGQELRVGSVYRWSWYLVARNEATARHTTSEQLLTALIRASAALREDPVACANELAPSLGLTVEQLLKIWELTQFDVTLDQSLLLSLELQARWAIGSGLTEHKEVPNFLPAISSQALRAVDRGLVTVIDNESRP